MKEVIAEYFCSCINGYLRSSFIVNPSVPKNVQKQHVTDTFTNDNFSILKFSQMLCICQCHRSVSKEPNATQEPCTVIQTAPVRGNYRKRCSKYTKHSPYTDGIFARAQHRCHVLYIWTQISSNGIRASSPCSPIFFLYISNYNLFCIVSYTQIFFGSHELIHTQADCSN